MLFMVIERFKDVAAIGERFQKLGRMMPDGVLYHASWIDPETSRCFQVMEAPNADLLNVWVRRWEDLVDFEITSVVTSAQFWSSAQGPAS